MVNQELYTASLFSKLDFDEPFYCKVLESLRDIDSFNADYSKGYWPLGNKKTSDNVLYRDKRVRTKQELKGYRNALQAAISLPPELTVKRIKSIHKEVFKYVKDNSHSGAFKRKNIKMFVYPSSGIKYEIPVTPFEFIGEEMSTLISWMNWDLECRETHPVISICLFIYEFLCIHPFEDGNGRTSRVLTVMLLNLRGYTFVKEASIDEFIDKNRGLYINSLLSSSYYRGQGNERIRNWLWFFLENIHHMIFQIIQANRPNIEKSTNDRLY
jgi:Fic family protein